MGKLRHEAELLKAALAAGIQYAEGRKAVEFESADSARDKALYVYRLLGHSLTYRTALGPRAGQTAFTLRSVPGTPLPAADQPFLAKTDGFSLHAGGAAPGDALGAVAEAGIRYRDLRGVRGQGPGDREY